METRQRADGGPLLECKGLTVDVDTSKGDLRIIDGISFSVEEGRVLGIIGESGSGKSVTARAIMRLLAPRTSLGGQVLWRGEDLLRATPHRIREIRGREIAMIFQDPLTSLNPTQRIWRQISEGMPNATKQRKREHVTELLGQVGIAEPERYLDVYPHQLSGGQRQRVMIATALAADPSLLIADEATTALDVTVQARILKLLASIRAERGLAMILVSHDLRVVSNEADDVLVMYAGRACEVGDTERVIARPAHPYTRALRENVPAVRSTNELGAPLPGAPVSPAARPSGCAFRTRCAMATDICAEVVPPLRTVDGREVACHHAEQSLSEGST